MQWRRSISGTQTKCCGPKRVNIGKRLDVALQNFKGDARGSIISIFAFSAPVIFMIAGFSIDIGVALVHKQRLQAAVDAGAIAAAREYTLINSAEEQIQSIAKSIVQASLKGKGAAPHITVTASSKTLSVQLSAVQDVTTFFGGLYGDKIKKIRATAKAIVVGSTRICILALNPVGGGAISLESSARITGNGCAVYSNSTNVNSIKAKNNSVLNSSLTCSAGGYSGAESNFEPEPLSDCPPFADPLADRPEPDTSAGCMETDLEIVDKTKTLSPGIYCGGILISGKSDISLDPGIYIIKNGPLKVGGQSTFRGENVGFYLNGNGAVFNFGQLTTIEITAPSNGIMAGLLFFESRDKSVAEVHQIRSNYARLLLGTIYLSIGSLMIDANAPIADKSAYTAIVARSLKLFSGPNLVLNTNYGATDIPVPAGIKGAGNIVALSR